MSEADKSRPCTGTCRTRAGPWWPEERRHPTLHTLLVHTIQETARHAGHADIIRETIDGAVGVREEVSNMPPEADAAAWKRHYDKLEGIARSARS